MMVHRIMRNTGKMSSAIIATGPLLKFQKGTQLFSDNEGGQWRCCSLESKILGQHSSNLQEVQCL